MRGLATRTLALALLTGALLFTVSGALAFTGNYPKMQVRLEWPTPEQLTTLRAMPDLDPMKVDRGREIMLVSNPDQVSELEALGFKVEVLIPDMEEYYALQREGYRNFGLLYTYSEMITLMDEIHAEYPNLTTARYSIGTSIEGRTLWAMKISDNPNIDEDEPEVGFDGVHHAREPITVNVLIETMRLLLDNYGVDPEITFLVNNREIYFVPVVNPDGYVYNEQTYPSGGGMWRKNRHAPVGGCYGVDLNRNYPYMWGGDGSSGDPCDETYRGTSGGSEPEIAALMSFINDREMVTYDTFHSVAGQVLFPWCYTTAHTPDDAKFRGIAQTLAGMAGYDYGQPPEILYVCSGVSMDWLYGEQLLKPKIFGFSTEVGGSGFWPTDAEVAGLVAENLPKNLYLLKIAAGYPALSTMALTGGDGDGLPDPGETLGLTVTLQNESPLKAAQNVAVTLTSDDPYLQLLDPTAAIGNIAAGGTASNTSDALSFAVDSACPAGHLLTITVRVTATAFDVPYAYAWTVGEPPSFFVDAMESGQGGWTHAANASGWMDEWHMSTLRNHTPGGATSWKFGATTSGGTYANHADGVLVTPLIAINADAQLRFWHWMDAEESSYYAGRAYDGGVIEMSVNGGLWTQVTPEAGYTHTIRAGSQPGPFPADTPVFSGTFDWREDAIDVTGVTGNVQFRFRFGSDGADAQEGWYVDDVILADMSDTNQLPTAPLLVSPADGATVGTSTPALVVQDATDPDLGDELTYGFKVYGDAMLTDLVAEVSGIAEGAGTTSWTVTPPLANATYYWRAYADDGSERGPCMAAARFRVEASGSAVPEAFASGLRLLAAAPNPMAGTTALRFELAHAGHVRGVVLDVQGRVVRALAGRFTAGPQSFIWDGRDGAGRSVPGGVYLYKLEAGQETKEGRVLVVR
jgi:carboxypeptidase T